ncbi:Agrin [Manis pentadactyla]|nr:Agrin [Manis pentadactyla]
MEPGCRTTEKKMGRKDLGAQSLERQEAQQVRLSTRQEQALRKKRHWQEAHGSQQAGDGGQQLLETLGLPETATPAPPVLTSAWQLLEGIPRSSTL